MSSKTLLAEGDALFVREDYLESIRQYSSALHSLEEESSAACGGGLLAISNEIRLRRSAASLKLELYDDVIEDCNLVLSVDSASIFAFYRKGLALLEKKEFSSAHLALSKAKSLCDSRNFSSDSNASPPPSAAVIAALNCALARVAAAGGSSELKTDGGSWKPTTASEECGSQAAPGKDNNSNQQSPANGPPLVLHHTDDGCESSKPHLVTHDQKYSDAAQQPTAPERKTLNVRYEWTQSDSNILLTFYAKSLTEKDCCVRLTPSSPVPPATDTVISRELNVELQKQDDSTEPFYVFHVPRLFAPVLCTETHLSVSKMKVELKLQKAQPGVQWATLAAPEIAETKSNMKQTTLDAKNWAKTCEEELEGADKPEGEAALTNLFKDIYDKGDDATRRAMVKSFQTSSGTVLSTNWNEVQKTDYENSMEAPHGQQVRRW